MFSDEIRNAKEGAIVWDRDDRNSIKGLHMKVTSVGEKMFYFYYRTRDGKQRRPKIGELGPLTLFEIRNRAKQLSDQISLGLDPVGDWEEKKTEPTVDKLFKLTWEHHWNSERFKTSGWGKEAKRLYEKNIHPTFGSLRLSEVTPIKVREWHKAYKDMPIKGNRSLAVFSKMFNTAEELELRNQHTNPCRIVRNFPEKSRNRFATEEEIRKIYKILEREAVDHPANVAFLYLLIFSGSRPKAIETATWDQLREIEVKDKTYGLLEFYGKSSSKTGNDEKVILPPQAMKIINTLPRWKKTICGIKFPRDFWTRIRKEAGCEDLWARDWRRTFASIGLSGGITSNVIGELLNHHSSETTKIYAKLMDGRRMEAATQIADKLEAMMKPELKLVKNA
jgi:integrase